jgi:preprotein translocase subunit SecG
MKALETMVPIILTIHILIAAALVVVVLLQRSEGGGLGIGGGGGGGGGAGLMTGRSAANLLTRSTGALAVGFFATSLILAILASGSNTQRSIIETPAATSQPLVPSAPTAQ